MLDCLAEHGWCVICNAHYNSKDRPCKLLCSTCPLTLGACLQGVAALHYELEGLKVLDAAQPSLFAGATLVALRDCVVGDSRNLAQFLVAGGLTSLMDMAEHCSRWPSPWWQVTFSCCRAHGFWTSAMMCSQLTQLLALILEAGLDFAGSVRRHAMWKGSNHMAWMHSTVTQ